MSRDEYVKHLGFLHIASKFRHTSRRALSVDADNDELRDRFRWLYSWVPRRLIGGQLCAAEIWCSVQVTASESSYYSYKIHNEEVRVTHW